MLGLSELEQGPLSFTVDRTWTTRVRRPNEGDSENVFATTEQFEAKRKEFLFTFQTYPTYEYGIDYPKPLLRNEVRMRILMPVFAQKFRSFVEEPTYICSIQPRSVVPEMVYGSRDQAGDMSDMRARLDRYETDIVEANKVANIRYANTEGLDVAVAGLCEQILRFAHSDMQEIK